MFFICVFLMFLAIKSSFSGINSSGVPYIKNNNFDTNFEMDFNMPSEEIIRQRLQRERQVKIDKTYVAPPKILFIKNLR